MYTEILDDEKHVEEVVALYIVIVADRGTQSSLHNQDLIGLCCCCTKNSFITIISPCNVSSNSIFIFNIRSNNISPSLVAMYAHLLGKSHCIWPSPWQRWHLMSEERLVKEVVIVGFALTPEGTKDLLLSCPYDAKGVVL